MHGPESLPYRLCRPTPRHHSPDDIESGGGSKIFQPTDSRQSGPEFGPRPPLQRRRPGASRWVEEAVITGKYCNYSITT
jgi:excinuclease ABC subunit B